MPEINFIGVEVGFKPKLAAIMHAIEVGDLAELYAALQNSSDRLRNNFLILLSNNVKLKGWAKAVDCLSTATDPLTAIRAAAVCLLMHRIEEQENAGI